MNPEELRKLARTAIRARLDIIEKEREALHAQIAELDYADSHTEPNNLEHVAPNIERIKPRCRPIWTKAKRAEASRRSTAIWLAKQKKGKRR